MLEGDRTHCNRVCSSLSVASCWDDHELHRFKKLSECQQIHHARPEFLVQIGDRRRIYQVPLIISTQGLLSLTVPSDAEFLHSNVQFLSETGGIFLQNDWTRDNDQSNAGMGDFAFKCSRFFSWRPDV